MPTFRIDCLAVGLVAFIVVFFTGPVPAAAGSDCNQNGIDDSQDLVSPDFGDCNNNGVLDVCDVDPADPDGNGLVSVDLNHNRRPDECDLGGRLVGIGGHLFDINMATGHATRFIEPAGIRSDELPSWIAFAPDGTLFGLGGRTLRTINRTDWTTSFVVELDQDVISPTFSPGGLLYAISNAGLDLGVVDIETGVVTNIGPFGYSKVAGVAFSPNGHLYGVIGEDFYGHLVQLLEVDLETGAATGIGSIMWGGINLYGVNALAFAPDGAVYVSFTIEPNQLGSATVATLVRSTISGSQTGETWLPLTSGPTSIAFAPDGALYGLRGQGQPMTIDLNTGYCTPATGVYATDIAASPNGQLYGASDAWSTINVDSGAFTLTSIISLGYTTEYVRSFAICPDGSYHRLGYVDGLCWLDCGGCGWWAGCLPGLACAPDGTLLALQGNQIVRLDIAHELIVPVASLESPLQALAFAPQGIAYGVGSSQLTTVDVTTGEVDPIGPLGVAAIHDITYILPKMSLEKLHGAGVCVHGPDAPLADGCGDFDFDGDGSVDLRDVSGLWLVIPE